MLAREAIEHIVIAVAVGVNTIFRCLPLNSPSTIIGVSRGIPVVRVVRDHLVVPRHLSGIDVQRDDRAGVEIVALAARRIVYAGVGLPVPKIYRCVSGS